MFVNNLLRMRLAPFVGGPVSDEHADVVQKDEDLIVECGPILAGVGCRAVGCVVGFCLSSGLHQLVDVADLDFKLVDWFLWFLRNGDLSKVDDEVLMGVG